LALERNNQMKQRLTISLTNDEAIREIEELRIVLEIRLKQRLSIAQVVRRLTKYALAEEMKLVNQAAE
jgi:hypothetical protein